MALVGQSQQGATAAPRESDEADQPLVLIIDDDGDIRASLGELLQSVGLDSQSFASAKELLAHEPHDRPGCLVLDVRLPGLSGLDFQQQLAAMGYEKPIVFLTAHGDIPMTVQAMKAGAVDFLTKPFRDQNLIDSVMLGIERDIAQRASARITDELVERYASLTARERQVLGAVAKGRVNKQVAFDLGISEVTVKLHRSNAMRKMRAASIGELIRAWEALPSAVREKEAA